MQVLFGGLEYALMHYPERYDLTAAKCFYTQVVATPKGKETSMFLIIGERQYMTPEIMSQALKIHNRGMMLEEIDYERYDKHYWEKMILQGAVNAPLAQNINVKRKVVIQQLAHKAKIIRKLIMEDSDNEEPILRIREGTTRESKQKRFHYSTVSDTFVEEVAREIEEEVPTSEISTIVDIEATEVLNRSYPSDDDHIKEASTKDAIPITVEEQSITKVDKPTADEIVEDVELADEELSTENANDLFRYEEWRELRSIIQHLQRKEQLEAAWGSKNVEFDDLVYFPNEKILLKNESGIRRAICISTTGK
ncbi:hypothetical protein ACS0TY_026683 [Phlomoides rotata]